MACKIKGKVRNFKLMLNSDPSRKDKAPYCSFEVESAAGKVVPFFLLRDVQTKAVDKYADQYELAVRWSQVSQAVVAVLKDAVLHDRDVTCTGPNETFVGQQNPVTKGQVYNVVQSIILH